MLLHFCGYDDKEEQGNIPAYKLQETGAWFYLMYHRRPDTYIGPDI